MVARGRLRKSLAVVAVLAWAGAGGVIAFSLGWVAPVHRVVYQHALSVLLSIAITTTLAFLVTTMQTPIETAYRLGFEAGWADGHRSTRPVLVPERRMKQRRGERGQQN